VAFLAPARRAEISAELRARRWLVIPPGTSAPRPGGLRRAIDDAGEGALALRGALPRGGGLGAGGQDTAAEQPLRARGLGAGGRAVVAAGVALARPALRGGALDGDDSAALAAWLAAGDRTPVALLFDERDRDAQALLPRRLGDLATPAQAPSRDSDVPVSGEV